MFRWVTGAAITLAVLACVGLAYFVGVALPRRREENLRRTREFMTDVTGLPFGDAALEQQADDLEMSTQLCGSVDLDVASAMAVDLPPVETPQPWPGQSFFRDEVVARFPPPAAHAALRGIHGCRPGNTWLGYLDPESGRFWIEIMYPDWGGDFPGCTAAPWE